MMIELDSLCFGQQGKLNIFRFKDNLNISLMTCVLESEEGKCTCEIMKSLRARFNDH